MNNSIDTAGIIYYLDCGNSLNPRNDEIIYLYPLAGGEEAASCVASGSGHIKARKRVRAGPGSH